MGIPKNRIASMKFTNFITILYLTLLAALLRGIIDLFITYSFELANPEAELRRMREQDSIQVMDFSLAIIFNFPKLVVADSFSTFILCMSA